MFQHDQANNFFHYIPPGAVAQNVFLKGRKNDVEDKPASNCVVKKHESS